MALDRPESGHAYGAVRHLLPPPQCGPISTAMATGQSAGISAP
jgi:hypothetical protein